jgi:hypothetical protein
MSQLGQSRHLDRAPLTSGLLPTPDILSTRRHVSNVPISEMVALHLVTSLARASSMGHGETKNPAAFYVDDQRSVGVPSTTRADAGLPGAVMQSGRWRIGRIFMWPIDPVRYGSRLMSQIHNSQRILGANRWLVHPYLWTRRKCGREARSHVIAAKPGRESSCPA